MRVPSNDVTASSRAEPPARRMRRAAAATITETAQRTDLRSITFPLARRSVVEESDPQRLIRPTRLLDARGNTRSARFLNHRLLEVHGCLSADQCLQDFGPTSDRDRRIDAARRVETLRAPEVRSDGGENGTAQHAYLDSDRGGGSRDRPHGPGNGAGAGHDRRLQDHPRTARAPTACRSTAPPRPRPARSPTPAPGRASRTRTPREDLQIARTNFAAGLLGNPESVPKCPEASLQANTCPAATAIGTSRLDAVLAGSTARSRRRAASPAPSTTRSRSPTSPAAWAS